MARCDTCLTKLDDSPYRFVVLKDNAGEPLVLYFHYFYPCWDIQLLTDRYPDCKIVHAGFSLLPETILEKTSMLRNLRQNEDLW